MEMLDELKNGSISEEDFAAKMPKEKRTELLKLVSDYKTDPVA